MKKMNVRARIAALAAAGVASALASIPMAQAQPLFEFRTWSAPRYYEDAPWAYRQAPPRYIEREALPRRAVRRVVERQGYDVIGPIQLSGQVYHCPRRGHARPRRQTRRRRARRRDPRSRTASGGPPRPPANVGRARDRYASAPDASRLPPLPLSPMAARRVRVWRPGSPRPLAGAAGARRAGRRLCAALGEYDVEPALARFRRRLRHAPASAPGRASNARRQRRRSRPPGSSRPHGPRPPKSLPPRPAQQSRRLPPSRRRSPRRRPP